MITVRSSRSVDKPAGIAHRIGARLLHEVREALPPTIFFFVGFNFIVLTTNLLVAQYFVAVSNFMLATVAALVVGKAVLVANKMPLLKHYDRAPLIQPILFKTAFYWVIVFFARLLERFVHFSLEGNPPGDFFSLFDYDLLVASVFRNFSVDPRPVPDLCDGDGIQPSLRPRRAAAAVLHFSSVRAAAQPATAAARAAAAQPADGRPFDRRVSRPGQPGAPRPDRYPAAARAEISPLRCRRLLRCGLL